MTTPNTPANGGQILTDERLNELWNTALVRAGFEIGNADVAHMNQLRHFARAIEADLRAALAAPATEKAPNGIAATMRHDAGAFARCSYCHRYSLDPATLSDRQPVCECSKQHGWCGSFVRPDANSTWSGKSPAATAIPTVDRNAPEGWKPVPIDPTPQMIVSYLEAQKASVMASDECFGVSSPPKNFRAGYAAMLAAAPEVAQPAAQVAVMSQLDKECLRIGQEIQRAAGELPEGWNMEIELERGYGGVKLTDEDGTEQGDFSDHDGLSYSIAAAIDAALATPATVKTAEK